MHAASEVLALERIEKRLKPASLVDRLAQRAVDSIDSTNSRAAQLAQQGAPEGVITLARRKRLDAEVGSCLGFAPLMDLASALGSTADERWRPSTPASNSVASSCRWSETRDRHDPTFRRPAVCCRAG